MSALPTQLMKLVRLTEVVSKPVSWLWQPYLPLGKITLLEGNPGVGKTFLALHIAAAITRGKSPWEFVEGEAPEGGSKAVIYLSGEDAPSDTLKPRFVKQHGDEKYLYTAQMDLPVKGQKESPRFTLANQEELGRMLTEVKPALVVIDPLQAFLGAGVDMNRANQVRPVLSGVARIAEEHGCAVLLVRHLNKSTNQQATYRGMGSVDFSAAARSILLAGKHPHQPGQFVVVHAKNSVGAQGQALAYRISEDGLEVVGTSNLDAEQLLVASLPVAPPSALSEAVKFLREVLASGPKAAKEVVKEAEQRGIGERTLGRAQESIGVKAAPAFFQGPWVWSLPATQPAESAAALTSPPDGSSGLPIEIDLAASGKSEPILNI